MSMSASPVAVDVDHRAFCCVAEDLDRIVGDDLNDLDFVGLVDDVLASVMDGDLRVGNVDHIAFVCLTEQLQRTVGDDLDDLEFSDLVDAVTGGTW